jgi:dihydrofolate reductase
VTPLIERVDTPRVPAVPANPCKYGYRRTALLRHDPLAEPVPLLTHLQGVAHRGGAKRAHRRRRIARRAVPKEQEIMRKVVASEFISLDGVVQAPGDPEDKTGGFQHGGWHIPYWSDELESFKSAELSASDALLLGRVTYEGFAAAWPEASHEEGPYADRMNNLPKYVVSSTLDDLTWNNSHLLEGELKAEVMRLKGQPGKDILIFGSIRLIRSLMKLGLVDELRLQIHPVVVGSGTRLFDDAGEPTHLTLAEVKPLGAGVIELTYTA